MLTFYMTHSCVFQEIGGLNNYTSHPREAMVNFCKQNLFTPSKYGWVVGAADKLFSYYVFSAGIHDQSGLGCYGHQFAQFIKDNGLGLVATLPVTKNEAFHPKRYGGLWIWSPDTPALRKWYEVNK